MKRILVRLIMLTVADVMACKEEGALEKAGKKFDKAVERAADKLDEAKD